MDYRLPVILSTLGGLVIAGAALRSGTNAPLFYAAVGAGWAVCEIVVIRHTIKARP